MQGNDFLFLQTIYGKHLAIIKGIHFTRREIDVMACLLHARGTSRIAGLLVIAPSTVITHIQSIMAKLGCNSREGIIDFTEKSHKLDFIKKYYAKLMITTAFEKILRDIWKFKKDKSSDLILYWNNEEHKDALVYHLKKHLKTAGIEIDIREQIVSYKKEERKISGPPLLFFLNKEEGTDILQGLSDLSSIDVTEQQNYYSSVFEILKKLHPHLELNKIIADFEIQYIRMGDLASVTDSQDSLQKQGPGKNKNDFISKISHLLKKWHFVSALFILCVFALGILVFKENRVKHDGFVIQSDLVIPTESTLLSRPELINQLNNKFKVQDGIQTIALIGMGGAGKTTLARQYARQQKANVIWQINAETPENLKNSFESLAYALAKTEEDKKILTSLLDLKNPKEKEDKIIFFIKKRMRAHPHWLLIYDNVDNITDIQNHFPQDAETWGSGRIVLTTRNLNIQNHMHVNDVLLVKELNLIQKFALFHKIMTNGSRYSFTHTQREEAKKFLTNIPPFPLDVALAAHYLKVTNVSYEEYLQHLNQGDKNFETVQESVLKEAGDYTKTRYHIITISLKQIMKIHKDFKDLLLFISLLDSQNIPIDVLNAYKNNVVVNHFIYNLKKYSFISNEAMSSFRTVSTFSLHRSTQAIILTYFTKTLNLKENHQSLLSIEQTLKDYMIDMTDREDLSKMAFLIRHFEIFVDHDTLFGGSMKEIISSALARIYFHLGNYKKAKKILEENLEILNKNCSQECILKAVILADLGTIDERSGNYEKAKNQLEQSLTIYKKHFPNNYAGVAYVLRYLGNAYRKLGDNRKARELLEQGVLIYKKNLPENHLGIARTLINLGMVYNKLGNYEKAKNLFEQSIVIYNQYLPESHIGRAQALRHLGNIYIKLRNYEKAKYLLEQSFMTYVKYYPKNHVELTWSLRSLGRLYKSMKDYKKAKSFFERSLVANEINYGKDHIETGRTLKNLGEIYILEGDFGTGERLFKRALTIFQNNKHPDLYIFLEKISDLYLQKSMWATQEGNTSFAKELKAHSIKYLKQALAIVKTHFPLDSPHITRIQLELSKLEQN